MSGRAGLRVMTLASLLCAGCGGVSERPGQDFSVRVLDASPIDAGGRIYAPVRFAVRGCGAFDLALEDGAGVTRTLPYTEEPEGTFVASVPTAWMREGHCIGSEADSGQEVAGTLVVTCHDAERSARARFALKSQLDIVTKYAYGPVRAVFPGRSAGDARWIAASELGGEVSIETGWSLSGAFAPQLDSSAYLNPMVRPRLVTRGDRLFATLGCEPHAGCAPVSLGPGESVPGERLADIDLAAPYRSPWASPTSRPASWTWPSPRMGASWC